MAKSIFAHPPLCEVCGKEPANSFSCFSQGFTDWKFVGDCTKEKEKYYLWIAESLMSPEDTVKTLAHLHEKGSMDWNSFMDMMDRLRDELSEREAADREKT